MPRQQFTCVGLVSLIPVLISVSDFGSLETLPSSCETSQLLKMPLRVGYKGEYSLGVLRLTRPCNFRVAPIDLAVGWVAAIAETQHPHLV
jgi:hypothetical protein